ncbi:MAG: hypothetical protein ACLTYH_08420 [Streptococcus salivarius]
MRKQRSPWTKKQQFIFGIIVIVATLIALFDCYSYCSDCEPYVGARKEVLSP